MKRLAKRIKFALHLSEKCGRAIIIISGALFRLWVSKMWEEITP